MKTCWLGIPVVALILLCAGKNLMDEAVADEVQTESMLAQKNGCLQCHSLDKKSVGPSFHDIAVKYKGDIQARNALIETVKNGGKGNWTEISRGVPMPPFSSLSDPEIERLVDWVLRF